MKLNQSFSYTGSSEYELSNINIQSNGIALFDTKTGIGGVDYMPADGDTITIIAGFDATDESPIRQFDPGMKNKAYVLITDDEYDASDKDLILSLASPIELLYDVGNQRYEASFVYDNPNDYANLYLIWDYTDKITTNFVTYEGKNTERRIDIDYGTERGLAGISYETNSSVARYQLEWNNVIVGDTGYVGVNSAANVAALLALNVDPSDINLQFPYDGLVNNGTGSLSFNKFSTVRDAVVILSAPLNNNDLKITKDLPSLTSFYLDPANGDLSTICAQTPSDELFHDGAAALPVVGDRIYVDLDGIDLFDGGNAYHQINTVAVYAGTYVFIDADGVVVSEGTCVCSEVAAPVIGQSDITLVRDQPVNIKFEATNNPTSWSVTSACDDYTLTGGTTGTIFNMTECKYGVQDITVNMNESVVVCSSTLPTVVGGDGTVTLVGPCLSSILPAGVTFDLNTGILSGTPTDTCEFSMELTATNCFDTSVAETVNITVMSSNKFKPFLMDVENFGVDGASACLVTPLYSVLYHNGAGDIPVVGDYIYRDAFSKEPLMGGDMWYNVYSSADSLKVCNFGRVCDAHTC